MGRLKPQQLLILSFLCAILIGTIILALPAATKGEGRLSLVDSLFTATSATCVTGLIVQDTGSCFTPLGRWVIFALFQAGGLGIMTFSTLFAVMIGRKLSFYESDAVTTTLGQHHIFDPGKLITSILGITLTFEALGTALLFFRWRAVTDWGVLETLERSVFHSVSGFCNAGFSLFRDSLTGFQADPFINIIMIFLIVLGGIGFLVIMDLMHFFGKKGPAKRLTLQSKIAITTSCVLILAGAALLLIVERNNVLAGMTWPERLLGSFFQSVTARTAGFNTLPIGKLAVPSLLFIIFLMFIGASPGSTGGGIKTCTFAVVLASVTAMFRNRDRAMIFGRSVPRNIIREAMVIFFLALAWIFAAAILFTHFSGGNDLVRSLFEITSAFGTVGLSTGITGSMNTACKLLITATMFVGRLGPLTLMMAVAFGERTDKYIFPQENVMVG